MKILIAAPGYPPELQGGVEFTAESLARGLVARGHEVHVLAGSERARAAGAPSVEDDLRDGVHVHTYLRGGRYLNLLDEHDPHCGAAFDALLDRLEPDIVHVQHWHRLTNDLIAIAHRAGVPAVVTLQDLWTSCPRFFRIKADGVFCEEKPSAEICPGCMSDRCAIEAGEAAFNMEQRAATLAQEIAVARRTFLSQESHLRHLESYGLHVPAENLRFVTIGVVELDDEPLPERSQDGRYLIGHWGNLSSLKGVLVLADAVKELKDPECVELHLAGNEVEPGLLDEIRLRVKDVTLHARGSFVRGDLDDMVAEFDVCVFPSLAAETHSLVVDEARSRGRALIVSDGGVLADRAGPDGVVVPKGDVAALREALELLRDPDERRRRAQSGRAGLQSVAGYAEETEQHYRDVLAEPLGDRPRDFTRDRLHFRNERLLDIAFFVDQLSRRYHLAKSALAGDADARRRLETEDSDVAPSGDAQED